MSLRAYQQTAHDAAWAHMKRSIDPCLIEAATGAGKSHVIAAIAQTVHDATGKRVLCLAPSAELVLQNREKYLASGNKASLFSASAGAKELRHNVVFGSPLTVKNKISRFTDNYALVVVDEAHGLTPTLKSIIASMREGNRSLRVLGLTATPYRLGTGYIFAMWPDGRVNDGSTAYKPYFTKMVDRITAPTLIEMGFLTKPIIGTAGAEGYDTGDMKVNAQGKFNAADVDRAYHGQGRLTSGIVADVMAQCRNREGVLFFAATVKHANEILASLPPELSEIVTGETPKAKRASILARFKTQQLKYLVNVSVLTTGFDAPHVDCIAILRKTESAGLWAQIMGRGLRLDDGKADCLILDYTTNIDGHFPDGDFFNPEIEAKEPKIKGEGVNAICPSCAYENNFTAHPDAEGFAIDKNGYCLDLRGNQVETEYGPMSAHYGRRCWGMERTGPLGQYARCGYRWTFKECPDCEAPNDISARHCIECKAEIVDPNDKLVAEFKQLKRDPTQVQTDDVLSMDLREGISQAGNKTIRADFVTPYRSFSVWFTPEAKGWKQREEWARFEAATADAKPRTVTYRKDQMSGFYRLLGLNKEKDIAPEKPTVSGLRQREMAG